jgi:hypothetical protein
VEQAVQSLIRDSNSNFRLSRVNAELALRGPVNTTPVVAGRNTPKADIKFLDASGNSVFRREVKCLSGGNFSGEMSDAVDQVEGDGEVFVQVPAGTDVNALVGSFWRFRTDEQLVKFRYVWAGFHDPDGRVLGVYMLGLRGMYVPGG